MKTQHITLSCTPFLAVALIACGSEELSEAESDDVAQTVSALTFEDGGESDAATDIAALMEGALPSSFSEDGSGVFTRTRGTLSYEYAITCFDADGEVLETCGPSARSAEVALAVVGSWASPRRSADLEREGQWSVDWDGEDLFVINGQANGTFNTEFEALNRNDMRTYIMVHDTQANDAVFDASIDRFTGGTFTHAVAADRTRTTDFRDVVASFDATAEVAFQADGPPLITINGERVYEANPVTGAVEPEAEQ
ncbi:MAG: hypothetical protein ACFB9M_17810 [Myxococcota bacterium]